MAYDLIYSNALGNAQQDNITSLLGASPVIKIMSGIKRASPDASIGSSLVLASLVCSPTFAPAASNQTITANAIANGTGTAAAASGTVATWFSLEKADGTGVIDGTILQSNVAVFTASIAGDVMTVTAVASGAIGVGQKITGTGIPAETYINTMGTGAGGIGTYHVSRALTVSSESVTSANAANLLIVNTNIATGQAVVVNSLVLTA